MTQIRAYDTPHGTARLHIDRSRRADATLLLGHGAGAGVETADLEAVAQLLPRHGISVLRLEQPWHVAGRRLATPPATLDAALCAVADQLRSRTPLFVGGRSAGARSAARCARGLGAAGCVALSFPLHPDRQPEKTRIDELRQARVPTVVIQGERDKLGAPEEFPDWVDLVPIPYADHSFRVPKRAPLTPGGPEAQVARACLEWIGSRLG